MEASDRTGENFRDHLPSYLTGIHPGGLAVFHLAMFLVILALASLPLVSVQVSVSGWGIIRPVQEKTRITAAVPGIVARIYVKEGDLVRKSDPLLQIRSTETRENLQSLYLDLHEAEGHLRDLVGLTRLPVKIPLSRKYIREYEEFIKQREFLELLQSKAERELARHEGLRREGLISEKEYDDLAFTAEKTMKELDNFKSRTLNRWQAENYNQLVRIRELEMQIRNTEEMIQLTTVYAPASGSMVEFNGIFEGSAVQAGTLIGILSPDSGLIGEFYVSSHNITYLRRGQQVRLHLDAFPSREWGSLPAHVYDISGDFLMLDEQPVYRVKCSLDKAEMLLRNGYSAKLKKGMTFQARCLVSRRTLFQLLADKADNWLNPAKNNPEKCLLP
jgi:multidrug resistance efflux pump